MSACGPRARRHPQVCRNCHRREEYRQHGKRRLRPHTVRQKGGQRREHEARQPGDQRHVTQRGRPLRGRRDMRRDHGERRLVEHQRVHDAEGDEQRQQPRRGAEGEAEQHDRASDRPCEQHAPATDPIEQQTYRIGRDPRHDDRQRDQQRTGRLGYAERVRVLKRDQRVEQRPPADELRHAEGECLAAVHDRLTRSTQRSSDARWSAWWRSTTSSPASRR